jgi:hypothetical protein
MERAGEGTYRLVEPFRPQRLAMDRMLNLPRSEVSPEALAFAKGFCNGVVLWAPGWHLIERTQGTIVQDALVATDAMVNAAQAAGVPVMMAVPCAYPPWCWVQGALSTGKNGYLAPDDRGPTGPWAGYLRLLMDRYKGRVASMVIMNEPNDAFVYQPNAPAAVADMVKSGATVAQEVGFGHVLVPALADSNKPEVFTVWMLEALKGWVPPENVRVSFAHHSYTDTSRGNTNIIESILALMQVYGWPDGQRIFITETGWRFNMNHSHNPADEVYHPSEEEQEQTQLQNVTAVMGRCRALGKVECWANYEYITAMWCGWDTGLCRIDGTPRPVHEKWGVL